MGASQRRGGNFIFELFFITEILCFLLPVVMGFGVFSNFRSWGGGKKFWMRREGEGAKNFRRIFEIVDIFQILG